jgi:hypothetical protein
MPNYRSSALNAVPHNRSIVDRLKFWKKAPKALDQDDKEITFPYSNEVINQDKLFGDILEKSFKGNSEYEQSSKNKNKISLKSLQNFEKAAQNEFEEPQFISAAFYDYDSMRKDQDDFKSNPRYLDMVERYTR